MSSSYSGLQSTNITIGFQVSAQHAYYILWTLVNFEYIKKLVDDIELREKLRRELELLEQEKARLKEEVEALAARARELRATEHKEDT